MTSTTQRRPRSGGISDRGPTPLILPADAPAATRCDAQDVNVISMRPADRSGSPADVTDAPRRPLRVLLTTDWWEPAVNGVVDSVATLRRALIALGCEVRVLTLSPGIRTRSEHGVYRIGSVSAGVVYDRARIGVPTSR